MPSGSIYWISTGWRGSEPRSCRWIIRCFFSWRSLVGSVSAFGVRLLDVKTALSARSYRAPGSVVIEVTDEFCPWNAGRWQVGSDGVDRTDKAPLLRCDVSALGSVYLGGFTWTQLSRALRVQELSPSAAAQADALFQTSTAPWCPEIF